MSRIQFKIGKAQRVVFNLPSKAPGDPTVCVGKVTVDAASLKCSNSLSFKKTSLVVFCDEAILLFDSLKGSASISSKCESFKLTASATLKGHIKFELGMNNQQRATPENSEWQVTCSFYDYADSLKELMESRPEINS